MISIHAPLRGRQMIEPYGLYVAGFQSTPPCGGDGPRITYPNPKLDFNPRPLAGATERPQADAAATHISIHAPLRGRPRCSVRSSR